MKFLNSNKLPLNNFLLEIYQTLLVWDFAGRSRSIRLYIMMLFFAACYLVIMCKVLYLVFVPNVALHSRHLEDIAFGPRKIITDRNGKILATNLTTYSIYANPQKILDKEEATEKISLLFPDIDTKKLKLDLESDKNFIWIKRNLTPSVYKEFLSLGVAGCEAKMEEKRIYTYGNLFAHVLGYVGIDGKGLAGIEQSLNEELTEYISSGKNNILQTSLDLDIQNILREELQESVKKIFCIRRDGCGGER